MRFSQMLLPAALSITLVLPVLGTSGAAQSEIELEGTISRVEGTTIQLFDGLVSFEARGARIVTDDESFTNTSDLNAGTTIEVEAVLGADGSTSATSIEVSDEAEGENEIRGVIESVDSEGKTFTIGDIVIAWDSNTRFVEILRPVTGRLVEVEVRVSGGGLLAVVVEREDGD